ncbi:formate dehydrogenase, gamma subunit [Luminiphilus syltensis NOR5-1B]|uniref:NADH-quinone oxidoreductase subunit E n=1 Tax=Luminiphilus syltensis NOR5-1B TaxID=565045 RepID=B8KXI9_9GAMM|nr:formate dehydrogenase subunit gamma [Luminiphilus syltensis]EED35177.1 formate dehydrogenase, gamma subunit [Luminiphilus syltensis NOR5-1B]
MQSALAPIIDQYRDCEGALLPLLHAVQAQWGHIPDAAIDPIARELNLSAAEVHGVISFYHDFKTSPQGEHLVQVCCAEACQARGSRSLESYATQRLGIDYGETTVSGRVTLERVYCLGNCACGPSLRIDDDVYARVDNPTFDALLAEKAEEPGL